MKNVRFGAISLALLFAVTGLITSVGAQVASPQAEPRTRARVLALNDRGAHLGVMVSDLAATSTTTGVRIDEVNAGSPAEKAGIKAGDVVTEYDGEKVRSARQFTRLVQETPEGRSVRIALMRSGSRQVVEATPQTDGDVPWMMIDPDQLRDRVERGMQNFAMPALPFDRRDGTPRMYEYRLPAPATPFANPARGRLGVTVQSLTPELEEYFGATKGGTLVSSVTPDSAAYRAGMKAGDVIVSVNGRGIGDADDLIREVDAAAGEATIVVMRDKKETTLKATIEPRRPASPRAGSRPGMVL